MAPRPAFWALLHRFKTDWALMVPVLVAAALGIGYGWFFYVDVGQFDPSSPFFEPYWLWPLVSDSPNAVLVWVVAVLAYKLAGWRHWLLDSLAFALNVYVGLWTTFLFLGYSDRMGTFDWAGVLDGNANPVLFISHLGMPLLGLVLVPDLLDDPRPWWWMAGLTAFLGLFAWVDYWGPHIHPAPFLHPDDGLLHLGAPMLMVVTVAALWMVWGAAQVRARRAAAEATAETVDTA